MLWIGPRSSLAAWVSAVRRTLTRTGRRQRPGPSLLSIRRLRSPGPLCLLRPVRPPTSSRQSPSSLFPHQSRLPVCLRYPNSSSNSSSHSSHCRSSRPPTPSHHTRCRTRDLSPASPTTSSAAMVSSLRPPQRLLRSRTTPLASRFRLRRTNTITLASRVRPSHSLALSPPPLTTPSTTSPQSNSVTHTSSTTKPTVSRHLASRRPDLLSNVPAVASAPVRKTHSPRVSRASRVVMERHPTADTTPPTLAWEASFLQALFRRVTTRATTSSPSTVLTRTTTHITTAHTTPTTRTHTEATVSSRAMAALERACTANLTTMECLPRLLTTSTPLLRLMLGALVPRLTSVEVDLAVLATMAVQLLAWVRTIAPHLVRVHLVVSLTPSADLATQVRARTASSRAASRVAMTR